MSANLRHLSQNVRPFAILGTGSALPSRLVTSSDLDQKLNLTPGSVERISGVQQRHFAGDRETASILGAKAAHRALKAANLGIEDIDCLVAASGTMDQGMPSNSALLHKELGMQALRLPAFDVSSSCLSFITALDTLSWPIMAGRYQRVLIVSSDIASCGLDWKELEASAIFGDGAAAAVVGIPQEGESSVILASDLRMLSDGVELCQIRAGGSRYHPSRINQHFTPLTLFSMDGKAVFKLAASQLPEFLDSLLAKAGLGCDDLDWIVPHQASFLALQHVIKRLGFKQEKVINIFADHGNQVSASIPTALDIAVRRGDIKRGQRVLLLGTGAGVSLGGIVLEY